MTLNLENITYINLIWTSFGFAIVIGGVFALISNKGKDEMDYGFSEELQDKKDSIKYVKSTEDFSTNDNNEENNSLNNITYSRPIMHNKFEEDSIDAKINNFIEEDDELDKVTKIKDMCSSGFDDNTIAKKLGIGIGEVQLVTSLYKIKSRGKTYEKR